MKRVFIGAMTAIFASAAAGETAMAESHEAAAKAGGAIIFKPPKRGAPSRRVGGATRSDEIVAALTVIAPEGLAYAATAQPVLYWRIDGPIPNATLTVIADGAIAPLVEAPLGAQAEGGVKAAKLAEFGARLKAGTIYEWSIAIIANSDARSEDIVSSATIMHQPRAGASDLQALGAEGYWYDLMAALLGPDPTAASAENRAEAEALIASVGLAEEGR